MDDRFTYRDIRAIKDHYCRENDNIVGFFGGTDEEELRSSNSEE